MWEYRYSFRLYYYLAFIATAIISHLTGNFSVTFFAVTLSIWVVMYFVVKYIYRRHVKNKKAKEEELQQKAIDVFKKKAECIKVDLDRCEIKSNNYSYDYYDYYNNSNLPLGATVNLPSYDDKIAKGSVRQSVIVYQHDRYGSIEEYINPVLPIDNVSLLFLLDAQKDVYLYVDVYDNKRYYFDLDFLM